MKTVSSLASDFPQIQSLEREEAFTGNTTSSWFKQSKKQTREWVWRVLFACLIYFSLLFITYSTFLTFCFIFIFYNRMQYFKAINQTNKQKKIQHENRQIYEIWFFFQIFSFSLKFIVKIIFWRFSLKILSLLGKLGVLRNRS